ncbi:inositol hexakisphosphate kinase 1 [Podospora aff. communis PSN243]|uniref:Kinase n=1 Tax=Podospora aff. communis PSN243 TaxID=3040156 RepID=A0AAV9GSY2_9PEZI|nr:inositol hexakisphosphate kinase 1 [Podospora aff. communis PSN243]
MASSTAVATTVAYKYGPVDSSSSVPYNMLDLGEVNSMLNGHREFLTKSQGRGTSLERTDRERRAQDKPHRLGALAHISASSNALVTPPFTESPSTMQPGGTDTSFFPEVTQDSRARKVDHRVSLGPEKAWSISTGEVAGEDGQVEKSITEAITGTEPNARASRKASHSLRFFKEGNPDDKAKKKDARHAQSQREKLPPTAEAPEEGKHFRSDDSAVVRAVPAAGDRAPEVDKAGQPRVTPARISETLVITTSTEEQSDKSSTRAGESEEPRPSHVLTSSDRQVADERDSTLEVERRQSADEVICEVAEEGEESGEEKISSALFVPHQGPDEASEEEVSLPNVTPRAVPSRTLSRTDDFHPWLVKAGEPEPDDKLERVDYERKPRPEPADIPTIAREVDISHIDGSAIADESDVGVRPKPSRPVSQYQEEVVHDHQWTPKQPLEAIELIPYKHQVGGHTTLWRFSRRAVCKQLNNRENEFYEKIEKYHRDLLAFLPRYIGVLNVTFQKKPRRKSTLKRDEAALLECKAAAQLESDSGAKANGATGEEDAQALQDATSAGHHRVISQSLQAPQNSVPTVTFVDNQHILPRSLLEPQSPVAIVRARSASATVQGTDLNGHPGGIDIKDPLKRPSLQDYHANSWGATTVNKKLRNEVFNDAFLKRPIAVHRHRKGHQRGPPRRTLQQVLRPTGSDPSLTVSRDEASGTREASIAREQAIPQPVRRLAQTQSDIGQLGVCSEDEEAPKDVTGTSAPEPEILADSPAQKKKRRYSGTGLRRKPKDVTDSRGDLKYYEEADDVGYKGSKGKPLESVPLNDTNGRPTTPMKEPEHRDELQQIPLSTVPSSQASELPSPTTEFKRIPRPVNPKEAQTQRDSRVEYFLLLEDLTAGMKRPCIMDLKMGTRQYGVDANPKKQKSQQGKCAKTTSRELGVRVCGLQVWDVKTQGYVFKDKYYGRDIKKGQEFQDALTRFLYDGVDRSSILRHIPTVLQKLDQLEVIIGRLRGYRFYAASLLMFYDGGPAADYDAAVEDSTTDFATDTEEAPRRTRKNRREIDFKIADFANCITPEDVTKDKSCPPRYPNEPDRGFLRGLRSLRKYFLKIQRDTRASMGLISGQARQNGELDLERAEDDGLVSE